MLSTRFHSGFRLWSVTLAAIVGVSILIGAPGVGEQRETVTESSVLLSAATALSWSRYAPADQSSSSHLPSAGASEASAVRIMMDHHIDAIDASDAFLKVGAGSDVTRAFAQRIHRVQSHQVEQMHQWLLEQGDSTEPGGWDEMFCSIASVTTESGYLATMILHHEAAVAMYESYVADEVISDPAMGLLMRKISLGQIGEIEWMRQATVTGTA